MATLTGVLLDVSGSMKKNAGGKINEKGGEWARSIFKVIDNLIKYDVSTDNYIFSVGVGANGTRPFFDVIETVKEVQHRYNERQRENNARMELQWEKSIQILRIKIEQEQSLYDEMQKEYEFYMEIKMRWENSLYDRAQLQWGYLYKSLPLDNSLDMEKQRAKIEELKNQLFYKTFCKEEAQKEKDREDTLVEHKYNEMYVHTKHAKEKESSFLSHHMHEHRHVIKAYDDILEEFYTLVEKNGALMTRIWAPKYQIQQVICYRLAVYILDKFKADEEFLKTFVQQCLPRACSSLCSDSKLETVNILQQVNSRIASTVLLNISEIISAVVDNANIEHRIIQSRRFSEYFDETCLKNVGSVFSVLTASDIFRDILDERMSAEKYTTKIMKVISPFIYGKTPLFEALNITLPIFSKQEYSEYKKLLIVLSDGLPTDSGDLHIVSDSLEHLNVIVVGCFISGYSNVEPRKLHSVEKDEWDEGAKFLFKLSSTIPSQLLPRTIFIKRGWDIDICNNETKLFLQINHPENIHEAYNLARNVVCCQDSLSDLLVSVSFDIYINQTTSGFKAQLQVGGTCYANASAAVLHLSMKRILGRDDGYPDFDELRKKIIKLHKKNKKDGEDTKDEEKGANTLMVLEGITPEYRLHCKPVDAQDAMKAIAAKRPVVATFRLTDSEWYQFSKFFQKKPTSILTKAEIDLSKRDPSAKLIGHAVVLTSFNSECFRFMNSWGDNWADMGFFKVQNSKVLDFKFIDVFWTLNDLSKREIDYFKEHGAEVADKIMKNLIGLQESKYKCPECSKLSRVTEFSGSLTEAVCPKCYNTFRSDDAGNSLALNIYLTSLSK